MNSIKSLDELDSLLLKIGNSKLIMLYFGSPYCAPCKQLQQEINKETFINTHPKLYIIYIDVSNDPDNISELYNINVYPTQLFINLDSNYKVIINDKIEGLNLHKIEDIYNNFIL
jgi:thiol-disulfide isomerase/thioredoxin